jgi:hypothetical protein
MKNLAGTLVLAAALTVWAVPVWAQSNSENFQFNELDFDRQGSGQGPSQPTAPATKMLNMPGDTQDPDAGLTDLFSGDPAPDATGQGNLQNLPGEPSPVSVPAAQGEAKIELAGSNGKATAKPNVQRRARSRTKEPQFRNMQEKRFYYAMQAWRNHPEISPVNCQSYLAERPLYHVRCLGALARR